MKQIVSLLLAIGALGLAGCDQTITFSLQPSGTPRISPSPPNVAISKAAGDTVTFRNEWGPVHTIVISSTAGIPPVSTSPIIYPPSSIAGRATSYKWTPPGLATPPPVTFTWICTTHPTETGTITVNP